MNEVLAPQHARDSQTPASPREDPFAAGALTHADKQMARFVALLALIDRSVLPRTVTVETESSIFSLDVAGRSLALLPRRQNAYAADQQLAAEAPKTYRLLGKRAQGVQRATERLQPAREALLRCAGRLLWALAGTGRARASVSVVRREDIAAGVPFSALELYHAAAAQAADGAAGPASAFAGAMRPRALSAWRATRSGWVLDWPHAGDSRTALQLIARISQAALNGSAWLTRAGMAHAPSLSFLSGTGHQTIRCIAADENHLAHMTLHPAAWAGALQIWDAICAGPVPGGAAPTGLKDI